MTYTNWQQYLALEGEEESSSSSSAPPLPGEEYLPPPTKEDGEEKETTYSNSGDVDTEDEFTRAKNFLTSVYGMSATTAQSYLNAYGRQWYTETEEWPTLEQLASEGEFHEGAMASVSQVANPLPKYFWSQNQSGSLTFYANTPEFGPRPVALPPSAAKAVAGHFGQYTEAPTGVGPRPQGQFGYEIPILPAEMLTTMYPPQPKEPPTSPRGGGGGGSGRVYDRDQIIEGINSYWRNLLIEDNPQAGNLADRYIKEAQAFSRRGGSLDFETWVRKRIRETGRYKMLYARLPSGMDEDDYVNQYRSATGQLGLGSFAANRQIEAGLQSGAGIAGFTERVGGTREARLGSAGSWSQRFAQSVANMGIAGRIG